MDNFKVLLGVSGGADSMMLLDLLYKKNWNLIVIHINYNIRKSSLRDENIVREYCKKRNINLYVYDDLKYEENFGNFENWARVERYKKFKEIYFKEKCKALFLGHHLDDYLETYFIQKERKTDNDFLGIKYKTEIMDMKVIRPLLNLEKKEIIKYCQNNNIIFGEDETNLNKKYLRNKIRLEKISLLTKKEKENLFNEIEKTNIKKQKELKNIKEKQKECYKDGKLFIKNFITYNEEEQIKIIYEILIGKYKIKIPIKKFNLIDIIKKIKSNKPNILLYKFKDIYFYKEYEIVRFRNVKVNIDQLISYPIRETYNDLIEISNEGKNKDKINIKIEDFPLRLILKKEDTKNIKKEMVKNKIPLFIRENRPVLLNKNDELILELTLKKKYNKETYDKDNKSFYIKLKGDMEYD